MPVAVVWFEPAPERLACISIYLQFTESLERFYFFMCRLAMTANADIEAFRAQDRCPLHGLMESQGLDLPEAFRISFGEFCYMPILHEQSPALHRPKNKHSQHSECADTHCKDRRITWVHW